MQPHAGVQVVVVRLTGHVGHGEVDRRAVGDGHCNRGADGLALACVAIAIAGGGGGSGVCCGLRFTAGSRRSARRVSAHASALRRDLFLSPRLLETSKQTRVFPLKTLRSSVKVKRTCDEGRERPRASVDLFRIQTSEVRK